MYTTFDIAYSKDSKTISKVSKKAATRIIIEVGRQILSTRKKTTADKQILRKKKKTPNERKQQLRQILGTKRR